MKYRNLNFFLIGVLVTLFIFGFNTPLLSKFKISYTIPASWPEFLTAVGTILASIVAVTFGIWGRTLNSLFYKSDMKLIDYHQNRQTSRGQATQGQTRLKFLNNGSSVAEDVIVYVEEIKDNGNIRPDFLPVPLSWTHDGNCWRNFLPFEVWYLDLCRKNDITDLAKPVLVLARGQQVPKYEDIEEGYTALKIKVSHKSGQTRIYIINLFWKAGNDYVQIKNFNEIV